MCDPFEDDERASFYEDLSSPNVSEWMTAMREETGSMKKNQV